jgi:2-methylcitrate dehydratase PrpD
VIGAGGVGGTGGTIQEETSMHLTAALGRFVAELSPNRIPEEARRVARMGFIDTIGTMIAGRNDDAPQILRRVLAPSEGAATLYFAPLKAPAPEAAWINGTAGHALDYDDVALRGHPSTVLVPAILAEAEQLDASGDDMLVAYIAGYETWAELCNRDPGLHHGKGWHPTGIFGAIGAAAACARLRRLDAARAAQALAIGASQSAGLMANFGTMTKPFHAGRAAHAGLLAARLAEAGFTAAADALEHPQGFLSAVSPAGDVDRSDPTTLGSEWRIVTQGLGIKKYPTCYCTHRSIDAMLGLLQTRPLRADDIRQMTASLSQNHATILRNHAPDTGLAAKFSIEFALAGSVLAGKIGLAELTDDFVRRADVRALMRRVRTEISTDLDPAMSGAARFDQVRIELADGGVIETEEVARATGHPARPLSDAQLYGKFRDCLEAGASDIPAETLFGRLEAMPRYTARQITAPA